GNIPFVGSPTLHRQPAAFAKQHHLLQPECLAQDFQRDGRSKGFYRPEVDHLPNRLFPCGPRVVMSIVWIKLGMIGIHLSSNLGNPDNRGRVAVAVEKEDLVSSTHL